MARRRWERSCLSKRHHSSPGAIEAVWPGIALGWGPVPGDLVDATRGDAAPVPEARARAIGRVTRALGVDARRTLAQQLVREVLGLVGPAVRAAATAWLEAMPAARQEAELDAAARRDRVALAQAALTPLGRLLDALERERGCRNEGYWVAAVFCVRGSARVPLSST